MLFQAEMTKASCWHLNIYEQDKLQSQLSWAWKKFYNLET